METATKPSTLRSIFQQRCPRCRMGRIFRYSIFRGFPKMCERCSICDLKFEREPGYFLGAMYISYVLGVSIMTPIAARSEEHTSELQSRLHLVCRLLLEKKNKNPRLPSLTT